MRHLMIVAVLLALTGAAEAKDSSSYTHGHFRQDGTYVAPHYSSTDGHHSSNSHKGGLGLMNPNIQPAKPVGSNGTP